MGQSVDPFSILSDLKSRPEGLTNEEVNQRRALKRKTKNYPIEVLKIFFRNFNSPLIILLLITAIFSFSLGDRLNAFIISFIVIVSCLISFFQEFKAFKDTQYILEKMKMKQEILRNKEAVFVDPEELVEGDILLIDAGDLIPLDCQLFEAKDVFANEASLTGEALPKEKHLDGDKLLKTGSFIVSGTGKAVILQQDTQSQYSELLSYISRSVNTTSFTLHLKVFSKFLMRVTLIFTTFVFFTLFILQKMPIQAFLFALSIAVGLSPQLLPAILTTNLALGARKMAKAGALTKTLSSIETFGNMDILCCDKTGTLTKGKVEMYAALDPMGVKSETVRKYSYINAALQTGFHNMLDEAILDANHFDKTSFQKLDEIPYDFERKRLSIYAKIENKNVLITKGALEAILDCCHEDESSKKQILERASTYYSQGFRLLGIASKNLESQKVAIADETAMNFIGFLLFFDPIKEDCQEVLHKLKELGIRLVMITGDHPQVAQVVAKQAGFTRPDVLDMTQIKNLDDAKVFQSYDVFARVDPLEKAKIIETYKKMGYTVGYLGDGINDSGALCASDVGISVETGTDLAKATADFLLVKKQLLILVHALKEGRKVFGNTIKYILMAISANFGNMFSMAGVALFIPYLPLLPTQILLINFLQDIPGMSISLDQVDPDILKKPQKWDISFIKKFMLVFGPISSLFDFTTFFYLKYISATPEVFRSAWFTESVLSATFIILMIRTKFRFYKSRPSPILVSLVFVVIALTLALPLTPIGPLFQLVVLEPKIYLAIGIIVICYGILVEIAKRIFYQWPKKKPMTLS